MLIVRNVTTSSTLKPRQPDIGYIPTNPELVKAVLLLAEVTADDILYDLGSGDGRVAIAAAQRGARGVGIDIDLLRIQEANKNAQLAGVSDRVQFFCQDLFESDFSEASVVFLYLLPHLNLKLLPLLRQLKSGTRIISHDFDLGDWKPTRVLRKRSLLGSTLYYWIIPE